MTVPGCYPGPYCAEKANLSPESLSSQKINGAPTLPRVMHSCFHEHSVAVAHFVSDAMRRMYVHQKKIREAENAHEDSHSFKARDRDRKGQPSEKKFSRCPVRMFPWRNREKHKNIPPKIV